MPGFYAKVMVRNQPAESFQKRLFSCIFHVSETTLISRIGRFSSCDLFDLPGFEPENT
jgi:hypothetical protein